VLKVSRISNIAPWRNQTIFGRDGVSIPGNTEEDNAGDL